MQYSGSQPGLASTGTHMPYGITQCYLPPGRGDIPAVTPAEAGTQFSDPGVMQGWVVLGTAVSVQPMPKAVYCSGRRDKHNRLRWDSNVGPLTTVGCTNH